MEKIMRKKRKERKNFYIVGKGAENQQNISSCHRILKPGATQNDQTLLEYIEVQNAYFEKLSEEELEKEMKAFDKKEMQACEQYMIAAGISQISPIPRARIAQLILASKTYAERFRKCESKEELADTSKALEVLLQQLGSAMYKFAEDVPQTGEAPACAESIFDLEIFSLEDLQKEKDPLADYIDDMLIFSENALLECELGQYVIAAPLLWMLSNLMMYGNM